VLIAFSLLAIVAVCWAAESSPCNSHPFWGFFGHRKINRQAVFTLPPEMLVFFKKNVDFLTEHAVDADVRRYASAYEAPRHFMDLDRYGKPPFPILPRNWAEALMRFSDYFVVDARGDTLPLLASDLRKLADNQAIVLNDQVKGSQDSVSQGAFRAFFVKCFLNRYYEEDWSLDCDSLKTILGVEVPACKSVFAVDKLTEHGILPYHLSIQMHWLTRAFEERDARKILRYAADIGHYIADAHVPLHTTQNYNGQLTNQDGIHAFWESRLPELYADRDFDFWTGRASAIENPQEYFWKIALESHSYVDSVLAIEQALREAFPPDQQLCNEMRGEKLVNTQCEAFAEAYHRRLNGMVESRMRAAISAVGNAWYTAWLLAGQPELSKLASGEPDAAEKLEKDSLERGFRLGKIFGRPHE
jgi:hypothetical protein